MPDLITLLDGREMPEKCELVRMEREVLASHVAAMWRLDTVGRREYLAGVQRSQGQAWRDAVARLFLAEWEEVKKEQGR